MNTKPLSKATRFEVFKRDKFTCQYCGAKAPDVMLECDHIHPRAQDGGNDVINLLTACHACNNGKRDKTLSDDSVVAKQHAQLAQLQDRREQLEMMMEWQRGLADLTDETVEAIASLFSDLVPGWSMSEETKGDVKRSFKHYAPATVAAMVREAAESRVVMVGERATEESCNATLRWFVNELTYRHKREKNPDGMALRYIFGIVRNRCGGLNESRARACKELLQQSHANGATTEHLKAIAVRCEDWNDWVNDMYGSVNVHPPTAGGA